MLRNPIARRKFLWLGSIFSVGLFSPISLKLTRSVAAQPTPSDLPLTSPAKTTVGFWQSKYGADVRSVAWQAHASQSIASPVVAAETLDHGDAAFFKQGVKVHLQGIHFEQDGAELGLQSLTVYAHYPVEPGHESQKVGLWSFQATPIRYASPSLSVVIPVIEGDGLTFSLVRKYANSQGEPSSEVEERIHFGVDQSANLKLQRGVYVLAGKNSKTGQWPNWQEHQIQVTDHLDHRQTYELLQLDHANQRWVTTDISYLLLTIDYAQPTPIISI